LKGEKRTTSATRRALASFEKQRAKKLRQDKLPLPAHPFRKGPLAMRGASGTERDLVIQADWFDVSQSALLSRIESTYASILGSMAAKGVPDPTLYCRFTFTTRGAALKLTIGSRGLGSHARSSTIAPWFFRSGLAYTLSGAMLEASKAVDDIDGEVSDSVDDVDGESVQVRFFLEFVTCRAYQVNR